MRRPVPVLLASVLVAGALALPAGAAAPAAGPLAFTAATVVDPVLGGTAPALVVDTSPAGRALDRSFVAWRPPGTPDGVALARSDDGARSYVRRTGDPQDAGQGGPACATAPGPACLPGPGEGTALALDAGSGELLLAGRTTAVSRDGGATVAAADTDLTTAVGVATGAAAARRLRVVARQTPSGVQVSRSTTGAAGSWSSPTSARLPGAGGAPVVDRQGRVSVPLLTGGRAVVAVSTDGGRTFTVRGPRLPARAVPGLAADPAGGLALAVVRPDGAVVLTRAAAGAARWSVPVRVDGPAPAPAVAASVVAGAPGRAAVGWYARRGTGWTPRIAQVLDGRVVGPVDAAGRPAAAAGPLPAALATPPSLALDARGHLMVAWTSVTGAVPTVLVARQSLGSPLLRGQPAADRPAPGAEPAGDARTPRAGRRDGPSRPGLDLTGTAVSLRGDGVLEVRVGLADALATGVPAGSAARQVSLVTRFAHAGRTFYAAATRPAGGGPFTFSAGELGPAQVARVPGRGGVVARAHTYPASGGATGRVEAGRVVVHVPPALVGRPRAGSRLGSVTSAVLLGAGDADRAGPPAEVVDATPARDVLLPPAGLVDGLITAVRPVRVLDTRRAGALRPGRAGSARVSGGAESAWLLVTALRPAADGEVRVGTSAPLPVARGRTSSSLVLTALAPGGRVALGTTTPTGLLVDVVGLVRDGAGSALRTVTPRRLLDTRGGAPLSGQPRRVAVPAGARAVLLAVTTTASRRAGSVHVWGPGTRPDAGGVPAEPGVPQTTTVLAPVAPDGTVALATTAGATHVAVDVVGVLGARGTRTYAAPPLAVVDTRGGPRTRPGQVLLVRTAGRLPATARQVVLQVTAYDATGPGVVTVWSGGARPDAASLRVVPGRTTSGLVVVDLPENRAPSVFVSGGAPHLRVDVVGATHG